MLNKVMIIGHLGAKPEVHFSQSGDTYGNMTVATDESYQDNAGQKVERTEWHRVNLRGKTADNCAQYLYKGSRVYVEGKLLTRKYTDKNGVERYATEIHAQRVIFLDRKNDGQQSGGQPQQRRAPADKMERELGPVYPSDDMPF